MFFLPFDPDNPPEGMPESMVAALTEQHRRHDLYHMSQQDSVHRKQEFLEGLNADQLRELRSIIDWVEGSPQASGYMTGLITGLLRAKGHCICGENHEPEEGDEQDFAAAAERAIDSDKAESAEHVAALMSEYDMEFTEDHTKVRCVNCKMEYPSLDDRMLRKPGKGGCPGCQQQTKWG